MMEIMYKGKVKETNVLDDFWLAREVINLTS